MVRPKLLRALYQLSLTLALAAPLPAFAASVDSSEFTVSLPGLANGHFDPKNSLPAAYGFGCDGGNVSPEIRWKNAPEGTKSLVLTVHDADAPTGIGWTHWVVMNIPAGAAAITEGSSGKADLLPKGAVEARTDFGAPGFGGPCPPQGSEHHYTFTLTALKIGAMPGFVTADSMPALVGFLTKANALGEAKAVLLYGR